MKRKLRTIRHILDNNHATFMTPIVLIPLDDTDNPKCAVVNQTDWNTLKDLGCSDIWCIHKMGFVAVWAGKARRYVRVARLIMDAKAGEAVSVIDGDETNLRRINLVLGASTLSKNRDRDFIIEDTMSVRPKAIHTNEQLEYQLYKRK